MSCPWSISTRLIVNKWNTIEFYMDLLPLSLFHNELC
ncbi:unnamed protein product [Haemonchus placei]|uniref:Uncharacterized protein n=1 Tax=Haemonchus placei TaxID=6290 RepID=A0A0N4WGM3_HAEPC|nr:unnamed protein product [Haemonchus placei]